MSPERRYTLPILTALVVAITPHATRLPVWVTVWCGVIWGYVLLAALKDRRLPGPRLRQALTVAGVAGGLATYGFSFDRDVGVCLLSVMLGLKPLEMVNHRDRMMTVFLAYFLVTTNLLYDTALIMTLYMGISVLVTTAALIQLNHGSAWTMRHLGKAAGIMVQALPLMVLFFVFFPRIQGSLWGSADRGPGTVGFSDHLEPGSLSELVLSGAVAFRAEFDGDIPPADRLYWRGLVFTHFNGERWFPAYVPSVPIRDVSGRQSVSTVITLEPHGQRWLFALDLPFRAEPPALRRADFTLTSMRRVHDRVRYRVTSQTVYNTGPLNFWESAALKLPEKGNPGARSLAATWRAETGDPERIIETALAFFRDNGFLYTLSAPAAAPLEKNRVDAFLFESRKGYCEHYASAFAFLMRAANLPCRIVGGYLGGERNPFGDYLIVRQSDAHVWVEVWLSGKGWVRIDPTAAVAPERVLQGAAAALAPEEQATLSGRFSRLGPFSDWVKRFDLGLDLVNSRWNQWVLGYSYLTQQALFAKFGLGSGSLKSPLAVSLALAAGTVIVGAFLLFRLRTQSAVPADPVQRAYARFCTKLAKAGLPKAPSWGPLDYARHVAAARPDLAGAVASIIHGYIRIRYAGKGGVQEKKALAVAVRRFAP